ncbi:MAG: hypothetical protein F8N37_03960 [Telmatospirillum sp.]|nr:hypothetical protein [Telmatospirillum sp.]
MTLADETTIRTSCNECTVWFMPKRRTGYGHRTGISGRLNHMTLNGFATFYSLPGAITAYGERFDPGQMTAAMTADRAKRNTLVTVKLVNSPDKQVIVRVNDTGPFARGADGRPLKPLQPDPDIIIDLTPAAFRALTGGLDDGKVRVTVAVS